MKRDIHSSRLLPNGAANRLAPEDGLAHDWYRFVLSFPPHLVRDYLQRFGIGPDHTVLDPFCGTGTTIVECKKLGIPSVGVEAIPWAYFVTTVKTDWTPDPNGLMRHARAVAELAREQLQSQGIEDEPPAAFVQEYHHSGFGPPKGATGWLLLGGGVLLLVMVLLKPVHPNVWTAPSLIVGGLNGLVMGMYFLVRRERPQLARLLVYLACPLFVLWVYTLVRVLIQ